MKGKDNALSQVPFPSRVHSGFWKEGHVQGIAVDETAGFIYYSFTTVLLKTDFNGNPVGSVSGIVGHLGCITFDPDRRRIYGSLELKHDAIGRGITDRVGQALAEEDAFYCVSFDCDRIDRMEMDAATDEVMRAVWLPEVVCDYRDTEELTGLPHRYGCSGIDGTAYGPVFGAADHTRHKIMIAYGIYGDTSRTGNDYQVILQYDPDMIDTHGLPLEQSNPHHSGILCEARYFFYTGNTQYGIQNLEYDRFTRTYMVAVYVGEKPEFVNAPLFFLDAAAPAVERPLIGRGGERGLCIAAAAPHPSITDPRGSSSFPWGQTGMVAFGDGRYAFSHDQSRRDPDEKRAYASEVVLYCIDHYAESVFVEEVPKK